MKSPEYGWLTGLTVHLNNKFPNKWAYSGSFAMYCIAASKEIECREPNDIDIVTSDLCGLWYNVRSELQSECGGPPGVKTKNCKIKGAKLYVDGISEKVVDIDVLAEGGKFGSLSDVVIFHQQTIILRVMSIKSLIASKMAIIKDDDDDDGKAARDVEFMNKLL